MNLYEIGTTEANETYQQMAQANYLRHLSFLQSLIEAGVDSQQLEISEPLIKALNFMAIVALHSEAGVYRSVQVVAGEHIPPPPEDVPKLMEEFVHDTNELWDATQPVELATFVLWRINWIHPFINGNGRTARAVSYYVFCLKTGGLLPGEPILLEAMRNAPDTRARYLDALQHAHTTGDIGPLASLVNELLTQQLT